MRKDSKETTEFPNTNKKTIKKCSTVDSKSYIIKKRQGNEWYTVTSVQTGGFTASYATRSVSYTHLDVYKRQLLHRSLEHNGIYCYMHLKFTTLANTPNVLANNTFHDSYVPKRDLA